MMKNVALLILIFTLFGCENSDKSSNTEINDENIEVTGLGTKKLSKDELAELMPDKIQSYIPRKEPEGLDIQFKNASFSFTTQYYYKESDSINIELFDYLDYPLEYERYSNLWWDGGIEVDNEELSSIQRSFGAGIDAWEVFDKLEKRTTVYVGVDNRFYLMFECFGKDSTTFIVQIAKDFDYDKLRMK